jgi:type VI secretion system secreted protein Hcp
MAFDAYLKLDGVEGQADDAKHEKWIQLLSYSHSIVNETTGMHSAGGAHMGGRCQHNDIVLTKQIDGTSPMLMLACCQGKSHPTATIELVRSGGSGVDAIPYQKIELTDVVVKAVCPMGADGSSFPTENVSVTYATIKWTVTKTSKEGKPAGEIVSGWDLKKNTKL